MFFLLKLISKSPLWLLYGLSSVLAIPLSFFYRRKLVLKNLAKAFPEKSKKELEKIANKFYRNFADVVVEALKSYSISEKELARRVTFSGTQIFFDLKEKRKPILFFASHQCNWEWMALASRSQLSVPGDVIYKPLQNKKADDFIYKLRSRFGGRPISKDFAAREIIRLIDDHRIIGLVADQSPPRDHVHWSYFFNQETDFYPGLVTLPYLMQAPAVFGRMTRTKRGHYHVEMIPIGEPPYQKGDLAILQRYIEETERSIRDHPADYLWTHNRWKHTREENEEIINFS